MNSVTAVTALAVLVGAYFALFRRGGMPRDEAHKLVAAGARLLDVRTRGEYASGHLPGAVNIPVQELAARLNDAGPPDLPIIVYCLSGHRSADAKRTLERGGFTHIHDLGAMRRW